MPITVDGVQYETVENIAEKYDYSIYHIRHLARLGKKGSPKGIKGFKHKGRWMLNEAHAAKTLNVGYKALERDTDDTAEQGQDYSCLEGL